MRFVNTLLSAGGFASDGIGWDGLIQFMLSVIITLSAGRVARCGLWKVIAGGYGFGVLFPLSSRPRSCVLPCVTLDTFSRLPPLASRPGVFHAKVAAPGI